MGLTNSPPVKRSRNEDGGVGSSNIATGTTPKQKEVESCDVEDGNFGVYMKNVGHQRLRRNGKDSTRTGKVQNEYEVGLLTKVVAYQGLLQKFSHQQVRADFINEKFGEVANSFNLQALDELRCSVFPQWHGGSLEVSPKNFSSAAVKLIKLLSDCPETAPHRSEDASPLTYAEWNGMLKMVAQNPYWNDTAAGIRCTHKRKEFKSSPSDFKLPTMKPTLLSTEKQPLCDKEMESGVQSPNSSEEAVVADPLNVIYLVKEEDIKPDIVVSDGLSDIANITDNENIQDVVIKEENLDYPEYPWQTESICANNKYKSVNYSGDQEMEHSIDNFSHNTVSESSAQFEAPKNSSMELKDSEDLDEEKSFSKRNERLKANEKPYTCGVCNRKFNNENALSTHQKIHTDESSFCCDICDKTFTRKYDMFNHKKFHTREKPITCDICYKTFLTKKYLDDHRKIHTGEKPFSCDICYKTFIQKNSMIIHKLIHLGEKPFTCDICYKTFSDKKSMNVHRRIHTIEKPFSSDTNNKTDKKGCKRICSDEKPSSSDIDNKPFFDKTVTSSYKGC